jgi:hypothetical protein
MLATDDKRTEKGDINYVPSPVSLMYKETYSVEVNKSGRLQYYKQPYQQKRVRITKTEFSKIYNTSRILAIKPIQNSSSAGNHLLLKFFTL